MTADDLRLSLYKGPSGRVGTRPKVIFEQGVRGLSQPESSPCPPKPPFLGLANAPQPAKGQSPSLRPRVSMYQTSMSRKNLGSKIYQISGPTSSPLPPTTPDPGTVAQGSLQATVGQEFLSHLENLSPGDSSTGSSGSSSSRHISHQGDKAA